jgi:ATP-dependent DNA helicase RecG
MSTPEKSAGEDKIEALVKILDLEKVKGYRDSAVMGGLDRYLEVNVKKEGSHEILGEICGLDFSYAGLSTDERREWVEKARLLLTREASLRRVQERTVPERPLRDDDEAARGHGTPSSYAGRSGKKSARRTVPAAKAATSSAISLDAPIGTLRGVGPAAEAKFKKLGVETVRDMLYFFPRRHIDYASRRCVADLQVGADQTLIGAVWEARQKFFGGRPGTEAIVGDDTGNIRVVWFNRPYLAKQLKTNSQIVLSGRVDLFNGRKVFVSPEWERLECEDLAHT